MMRCGYAKCINATAVAVARATKATTITTKATIVKSSLLARCINHTPRVPPDTMMMLMMASLIMLPYALLLTHFSLFTLPLSLFYLLSLLLFTATLMLLKINQWRIKQSLLVLFFSFIYCSYQLLIRSASLWPCIYLLVHGYST